MKIFLIIAGTLLAFSSCTKSSKNDAAEDENPPSPNSTNESTENQDPPENIESSTLTNDNEWNLYAGISDTITFTVGGGTADGYAINPALPQGLTLDTDTGEISGVVSYIISDQNYTLTANNTYGETSKEFSIKVTTRFNGQAALVDEIQNTQVDSGGSNTLDHIAGSYVFALSNDDKNLYVGSATLDSLTTIDVEASTGEVFYNEHVLDGAVSTELEGATGVLVSHDDKYVYVAGRNDAGIAVYSRDSSTGDLTHIQDVLNLSNGVTGLVLCAGFEMTPDGKSVFCGSNNLNLAHFSVNASDGQLVFVEELTLDALDGGGTQMRHIDDVQDFAFTSDSKYVYYSSVGTNSVSYYSRDTTTGELRWQDSYRDGDGTYTDDVGATIANLSAPKIMDISPDDRHLYVAADTGNAIVVFSINPETGGLTQVQSIVDGGTDAAGTTIANFQGSRGAYVSPDGAYVLTHAFTSGAIQIFSRNHVTGELTHVKTFVDTGTDSDGTTLNYLSSMRYTKWSHDGRYFFAIATGGENALSIFSMKLK